MKILDNGHKYVLNDNKSDTTTNTLVFFKDSVINNSGYNGTTNQEVLRVLINRVQFLNTQLPDAINNEIIYCLRKALILHEQRHLNRLLDKNLPVENLETFTDSHVVKFHN